MDKQNVVYVYTEPLFSLKQRMSILIYATAWLKLEGTMLSGISHSQKYNYLCDSTFMKYLESWNSLRQKIEGSSCQRVGEGEVSV